MKILSNRFVKLGVIPAILLLVWAVLTVGYIKKTSGLNILQYNYQKSDFKPYKDTRLFKGEKLKAEIVSKSNKLGIISVRFNNFEHINDDVIIYRIREKGQKDWYYQNEHTAGQFQPHGLFTFGFPLIENSEGKTYQFELESKKGTGKESVALSKLDPVLVTKHEYSKSALMASRNTLKEFFLKKAENLSKDTDFIISSLIYILPLLFYMLTFIISDKPGAYLNKQVAGFNKEKKALSGQLKLAAIPLPFILLDVIFVEEIFHTILIVIASVWIFIIINFKLESRTSFVLSLFFLGLCPLLLIINLDTFAEKSAIWAYVFLATGVMHQILITRKRVSTKLTT